MLPTGSAPTLTLRRMADAFLVVYGSENHPFVFSAAGLPDFSRYNIPKREKNIPNDQKMFQNGHKVYHLAMK
jgi:hypothetical protein